MIPVPERVSQETDLMDQCVCVLFCVRVSDHVHAVHEFVRSVLILFSMHMMLFLP